MKTRIFVCVALTLGLVGCNLPPDPAKPVVKKIIVAKKDGIESSYNFLTKKEVVESHYYLIAGDGTVCDVGVGEYATTRVLDSVQCDYWAFK